MHDYQLERLNTRSFEQLIQSLGTAIIGPQLMIFGDGPDGGREATFEGAINYPSSKKTWNGYGILQAKFRQQPDSSAKKNADWVIKQLKLEFAKLKPRLKRNTTPRTDRIYPQYYIFATNLVLSSVARTGGKDRVKEVFDGFKKSHGLKDYAIWDGDQIRRFLDTQPGIRTTYSAWLLPGDVLGEMMKVLKMEQVDFISTIRRYLESELLDDQFARLGQGGYTDAKNIPLCSVFVDLPLDYPPTARVRHEVVGSFRPDHFGSEDADHPENKRERARQESAPTFLRFFFEEGRQVLKPSAMRRQGPGGNTSKGQVGRIVLVGGPGQGKTTVGQYACQLLRATLLRATGGPFSPEVSQALERIEEMSGGLPPVYVRRYPLRVDLKHLAASLVANGDESAKSLFDYLVKRIESRTNSSIRAADFRCWLGAYPWVLVLDGLDEVPASSNRQQAMQAVRDFVSVEAHDCDADLLVLATTRPQGYSDEFDPSLYCHLSLAPLSASQALVYGLRLATSRHPGQRTRIEELTNALKRATTNPATVLLMQSPLQVTIMLALIEGGGEPPEQRWKLFHDYYDVIYRREKERGTPFSAVLGSFEPDIHWIHHRAGWLLQQRNAGVGRTDARLTHQEFEEIVDSRLRKSGHDDTGKRRELVKTIQAAATDRLVLLVGNTEKEIGFEIRSLQEFMAAEHFFDGGELCVQKTLHAIAPYPYWRNVFLFAAGRVFFERQELIDCIIAVCGELNEGPDDSAQQTILSGSRLALALLKDGAARNQPASIRIIARCGTRSLDALDENGAVAFAELFSGEAEEVWKEELSKRLTTFSPYPYHNWLLCLHLIGMGKTWAQELMRKHFPWKREIMWQFLRFSRIDREELPQAFWVELFAGNVFHHPPHVFLDLSVLRRHSRQILSGPLKFLEPLVPLAGFVRDHQKWPLVSGGKLSQLTLRVHGAESLVRWKKFHCPDEAIKNGHPEWRVYQAISAFARKPTKANLATQLTDISSIDLNATSSQWRRIFPWQINTCFALRAAGHSWKEIIANVNNGNFGSELDWNRWEGQNQKGITVSQFRSKGDLHISDEFQGVILRNLVVYRYEEVQPEETQQQIRLAEEVCDALIDRPEISQAQVLINSCCDGLYRQLSESSVGPLKTTTRFVNICAQKKVVLTTSLLIGIIISRQTVSNKLNLLAEAGACPIKPDWMSDRDETYRKANKFLTTMINELQSFDGWWNVLCALSFLPPLDALEQIPESLLEQLRFKGKNFAHAASRLKLNSLRWNSTESAEVVREVFMLRKDYPIHINLLLEFIESRGKSGLHLETFLIELIKQNPPNSEPRLLNRASGLLVKLVERRPAISTLPDPVVRQISSLR